ncbi:hypothetical protein BJ875DRAFT_483897 [Amylocarpus encephaloides]|uniref:Uncharacterized protein n=1 Tax=Amylocarpus encephaloides TaxID=45428 RepID=A0A9P8C5Z7_9HELO|nr:hypothetical protein BJ875DRAFT_483897 [Amylocarpus encephaloides]
MEQMLHEGPIRAEPPTITDRSQWQSLALLASEAPYRVPCWILTGLRPPLLPDVPELRSIFKHSERTLGILPRHAIVLGKSNADLIIWENLCKQLSTIAKLQRKYASIISPKEKLPEEYIRALLTFRYTLDRVRKVPTTTLKVGFPSSPPMRSGFVRYPQQAGTDLMGFQFLGETLG